jgi:hypothetical protein
MQQEGSLPLLKNILKISLIHDVYDIFPRKINIIKNISSKLFPISIAH